MPTVWINEFHYDDAGADIGEFIEIAGVAGTDVTGWSIVRYNGSNGAPYTSPGTIPTLSGTIPNSTGTGFGVLSFVLPQDGLQNGAPDGLALVDNLGNVVEFISYEGVFTATSGPAAGLSSIDVGVSESGIADGTSIARTGTGDDSTDFTWTLSAADTPGAVNGGQTLTTDPGQTFSIAATDAVHAEGTGGTTAFTFAVTRTNPSGTATVDWALTGLGGVGQADAADFSGPTSGTVTFTGSETMQTISVTVVGDSVVEPNETFALTLSNASTGTIANAAATGTIQDDDVALTAISTIQGTGHISPLVGQTVTTTGIVIAVDTNGSRGFYIQDPNGDGNAATSDGIFVFRPSGALPTVGHAVRVTGTVTEFVPGSAATGSLSTTEPSSVTSVIDLGVATDAVTSTVIGGPGGLLPPTESLIAGGSFYESLEGMLVTVRTAVAVGPTNDFGEIFTVVDNDADPSNGFHATGQIGRGNLLLTPGNPDFGDSNTSGGDFNPERIQIDDDNGVLSGFVSPDVNVGARLGDVTGVINYDFGNYQVVATQAFSVAQASTLTRETGTLTGDADHLLIASYNAENLDPKIEDQSLVANQSASNVDDDVGNGRFATIAGQIFNTLHAPDIVALQEIQDNDGGEITSVTSASMTLQILVDEINALSAAAGSSANYSFIDNPFINNNATGTANGGQPGGNIRAAYIYRDDRVDFVEGSLRTIAADGSAITDPTGNGDQASNPDNPFFGSRPPLVATFMFNGQEVTVVDNHFTSKGGSAPLFGSDQPPFNAGEVQRAAQAQAVNTFVDSLLAADANAHVIVAGDLNEFPSEEPMNVLRGTATLSNYDVPGDDPFDAVADYTPGGMEILRDLQDLLPADEQFDYVFEGNSQTLDHVLITDGLADGAQFDVVRINAEFFDQTSDHDPLVSRLAIPLNDPPVIAGDLDIAVNEGQSVVITTADLDEDDPDDTGATLTYTVTGASHGDILVNGLVGTSFTQVDLDGGRVGFRHDGSETVAASFTVILTDAGGLSSAPATVTASVTPVNDAPSFTSPASFSMAENQTTVGTVIASDPENSALSFALAGGDDSEFFAINAQTGALRFLAAPDETPADANANNHYSVAISVTDSGGAVATQALTIQVTDVAEQGRTINGTNRDDNLTGGTGDDIINAKNGDDLVHGNDGNDIVLAGKDDDKVLGGRGNDIVNGEAGDDWLLGDDGNDQLFGGHGHDCLAGGAGDDNLKGENGNDNLRGGDGRDQLNGGNGNDHLHGDAGNDLLTGGSGNDVFAFGSGFGHDVVSDFHSNDMIAFHDGLFGSFQAVRTASRQVGHDTVITLDSGNTITLQHAALNSLHANDFLFT
jgi:predicted extracellular nuclease